MCGIGKSRAKRRLKVKIDTELFECAKFLDKFYIIARYPNGWVDGFPGELITHKEARNAKSCAEKIIQFCEGILAG